jgi:hypothetical protein
MSSLAAMTQKYLDLLCVLMDVDVQMCFSFVDEMLVLSSAYCMCSRCGGGYEKQREKR